MQENQTLRNLLKGLGTFIGDGAGGLLPKLGWELSDFNDFINRSETDTAWEGYQRRKKTTDTQPGQKRGLEDESPASRNKKVRSDSDAGFSMMLPMQSNMGNSSMYTNTRPEGSGMFNDMMKNTNGSGMFPPASNTPPQYGGPSPSNVGGYNASYIPQVNLMDPPLPSMSFNNSGPSTSAASAPPRPAAINNDELEDDDDPNKNEAYKLIQYISSFPVP